MYNATQHALRSLHQFPPKEWVFQRNIAKLPPVCYDAVSAQGRMVITIPMALLYTVLLNNEITNFAT